MLFCDVYDSEYINWMCVKLCVDPNFHLSSERDHAKETYKAQSNIARLVSLLWLIIGLRLLRIGSLVHKCKVLICDDNFDHILSYNLSHFN